jgi:hypothetical protein
MPVNARFILLLAFVHSSAFAAAVPLDSRRVSDTVIEDGTPLGVSNRYHHFADARDVPSLGRYLRRSPQVSPPVSAFGTASGAASKVLGARDPPPGPGPEVAAAGPSPAKAGPPPGPPPPMFGPPGPQGPPGPSSPPSPIPYPYPYPYPFPYPEHEREHEYPHEFHGHELMEHEDGRMYHEYPAQHEYPYHRDDFPRPHDYPYDDYPRPHQEGYRYHHFEDLHAADFPHDEYHHDDFSGPPHDRYPPSHEFFYGRPGDEFEDGRPRGQRGSQREKTSGQRIEGESETESKRPNGITLPKTSSVDLASAELPARRAETEVPGAPSNSNDSPNISGLFSSLGRRGDSAVPADSPQLEAREDIGLPLPDNMSLGKISSRATKGNEVNEVAVEDHRTNPVEKLVTL